MYHEIHSAPMGIPAFVQARKSLRIAHKLPENRHYSRENLIFSAKISNFWDKIQARKFQNHPAE